MKAAFSVPEMIQKLDVLYNTGREAEARAFLYEQLALARSAADWQAELSVLSELMGYHRRDGDEAAARSGIERALALLRQHGLEESLSGATLLLNAGTTLKCFGSAAEALPLFQKAQRVYEAKLSAWDYRQAGLCNNLALCLEDLQCREEAEALFRQALDVLKRCPGGENEEAVTWCNLAELYQRQDPEDGRIAAAVQKAWEALNAPGLARDGYHAFTISKCAPSLEHLGFFLWAAELKQRAEDIYERDR